TIAQHVGAVNTFWFERGELVGDNTDVFGFDAAARQLIGGAPARLTVGLLGAGGAAAAVVAAVPSWPESPALIRNRTWSRAKALRALVSSVGPVTDVDA